MLVLGSLPPSAQMGMRVFPSEDDGTRMVPGPWLGAAPAYSECMAKGRCTSCGKRGKALQSNKPLTWLITVASRSLLGSAFFQYPSKIKVKEKRKNYVDKLNRKENMRRWNMLTKLRRTESRWMVIDLTKQGKPSPESPKRHEQADSGCRTRNIHEFGTRYLCGGCGNDGARSKEMLKVSLRRSYIP